MAKSNRTKEWGHKYTRAVLTPVVAESKSIAEVCRRLGIKTPSGGGWYNIKQRILRLQLDTTHFSQSRIGGPRFGKQNGWYKGGPTRVLVSGHLQRVRAKFLREALDAIGRKYQCANVDCGLNKWLNKPIRLHVDHIDGDWSNCVEENLRYLCPNCHSQTETFGYRGLRASTVIQRISEEDENVVRLDVGPPKYFATVAQIGRASDL